MSNRLGRYALIVAAVAATAAAQSSNAKLGVCAGSNPKLLTFVPTWIGTTQVSVPMCVLLGPGLTINMAAPAGPTLTVAAPTATTVPPAPLPRMVVDRVVFDPAIPATQTTLGWTLARTPAPGTMIIAVLRSSMLGENTVDIVDPPAATPKALTITLPTYRPFPDDGVLLQYWTFEP